MFTKEYILYLKDTIKLAKSLIIKFEPEMEAQNKWAISNGYAIQYELPEAFPYYMNLSGKPHKLNKPMFITSIDTLTQIPFTRESLLNHKRTLREYQKLNEVFDDLVEANYDQYTLIRGILNPIDIAKSSSANDGAILYYDQNYVESNEYNLIPTLQHFINTYIDNWYNRGYTYTDELYDSAFYAGLMTGIVTRILSIRLDNCGTRQVHSFHLWAKLGSHFHLDSYRDYINADTALWLYRNIDYIVANYGLDSTFTTMIDNVLTTNNIPISQLILINDETKIGEEYVPEPHILRNKRGSLSMGANDEILTIENVINRSVDLAEHNKNNITDDIEDITASGIVSQGNINVTKTFEAEIGSDGDSNADQYLADIIQYWAYATFNDIYTSDVVIKNAKGELIKLSMRDTFITWVYIASKLLYTELDTIPLMYFRRVPRTPYKDYMTYRELANQSDGYFVDDMEIKMAMLNLESDDLILTDEEFKERAEKYISDKYKNFLIYATRAELNSYVETRKMIDRFYFTGILPCTKTGMSYIAFFERLGVPIDTYSTSDLELMFVDIFNNVTGFVYDEVGSTASKGRKLVDAINTLTSYSIQFITQNMSGNGTTSNPTGLRTLRVAEGSVDASYDVNLLIAPLRVLDVGITEFNELDLPIGKLIIKDMASSFDYCQRIKFGLSIKYNTSYMSRLNVPLSGLRITPRQSIYLPEYLPVTKLNGLWQTHFVDDLIELEKLLANNNLKGLRDDVTYP